MMNDERYQICVIGTGAAGGILAYYLAKAGKHVIAIEKGNSMENVDFENTRFPFQRSDLGLAPFTTLPLKADRFGYEYADRHGLFVSGKANAVSDIYRETFKNYQIFAMGGKTNLWNGHCLRFSQRDFKARSNGDGKFDWPIDYQEMDPHYGAIEELIGVNGSQENMPEYPDGRFLPPKKLLMADHLLLKGLETIRDPKIRAIPTRKSVELREGYKNQCEDSGTCVKGCTNGSRYSFSTRLYPLIKDLPNFRLLSNHGVARLILDQSGEKIEAVEVINTQSLAKTKIYADHFVLSAGTVETPRILFNSNLEDPEVGIANSSGLVGRYLMDSLKVDVGTALAGLVGVQFMEERGYGSHLTIPRFIYDSKKYQGGFMAEFHHIKLEVPSYLQSTAFIPRFAKKFMVNALMPAFVDLMIFGACEPQRDNRLTIDTEERDHLGVPRLKAYFKLSQNDKNMIQDMVKYGKLILKKVGSLVVISSAYKPGGSAIHYAGTCRMASDAREGVVDPHLKTFDYNNLYICDGSVFPTLPEKGLTLTIMALAKRLSDDLIRL